MSRLRVLVALAASSTAVLVPGVVPAATSAAPFDNHLTLVSVADPEVYSSDAGGSIPRAISDDGRYVVFASEQPHLVAEPPPSSGRYFYVRDLVAGTITRVGRDIEGPYWGEASISGNGRFIVYPSQDSAADQAVVRLYDTTTGKTRVISSSSTPVSAGVDWYTVAISDNGRSVVYTRSTGEGDEVATQMYLYNVTTRATTQPLTGNLAGPSIRTRMAAVPSLSANGRYVAYVLPTGPGPDASPFELIRLDLTTGDRLVIDTSPPQYYPKEVFGPPAISNTGRFIAYHDLGDPGGPQVYLRDANKASSTLVSHTVDGQPASAGGSEPKVSGDGSYVTFVSVGTDLVAGPRGGIWNTYLWTRSTGTIAAPIRNLRGSYPHSYTAGSTMGYLDGDGSTMAFAATSANLVMGADNRLERTYVWQR